MAKWLSTPMWTGHLSYLLHLWRCGIAFLVLVASLAWTPGRPAAAPAPQTDTADSRSQTLRINLSNSQPATLGPATASSDASWMVLEQTLAGLVDLDDETGQVQPDLATGWTVSSNSTVYAFTLPSGVTWSDGHPVIAQDATFGILHSLDPATGAPDTSIPSGSCFRSSPGAFPRLPPRPPT